MRAKLMLATMIVSLAMSASGSDAVMFEAESKRALVTWAESRFSNVEAAELKTTGVETLVLIADAGSGLTLKSAFVYIRVPRTDAHWTLLSMVRTELPKLTARAEQEHIIVLSRDDGTTVVRIDLAATIALASQQSSGCGEKHTVE